ncbi:MAG: efflux RND transporter periplasmic adaptor subunit [Methylotenera sp.]
MTPNAPARHYLTHTLMAVTLLSALSACHKPAETENPPADEPTFSGNTVHFSANSTLKQKLITAPVVSSQENILSLPARITWDEDHTARISSPIAGHLTDVLVQIGAPVKVNQALAHLSSPDLGSAQADVERAKSDLAQAERNHARNKDLAEAGIIAGKDFEQAQSDLLRSKAEAVRAEVRLKSLGATDAVDQKFTIRSPIAGVLVARNINPGMEWRPDQATPPLFIVSDPTYLWCWIDAPEQAINSLHKDMEVILRSSAWPNETFNAQVDFIEDALDPASHTLKVRAKLRNLSLKLKSEMYVTATLSTVANDTLDIPTKAVFLKESTKMVFVKTSEGVYTRKVIVPVASNDEWVSISGGLNKGDEVVLDGALFLEKLIEENKIPTEQNVATPKPMPVN